MDHLRRLVGNSKKGLAQLHGSESPTKVWMLRPRAFKAIRPQAHDEADAAIDAYCQVRPWGVDVSSGLEVTKGVKNHARVRAFIESVHAADGVIEHRCGT